MSGSILEKFLILFESDAKEVKKGAEEAGKSTDDLERKIKSTDGATNKLGSSFLHLAKAAAGALAAVVSVHAVLEGISAASEYADMVNEASEMTGIATETISAWGDATKLTGGSTEAFIGTVKALASSMAQMDTLGRSRVAPFFKELGINMLDAHKNARSVTDLLPEIADAFQKQTKEQSLGFGRKMGLDEGTIALLQRGRTEVETMIERQRELGVVTKEAAEAADKYHDQLDDTKHAFRSVYLEIATAVMPALTAVLKAFETFAVWVREHGKFVTGIFVAMGLVISRLLLPLMIKLGIATIAATWPFILMGAAIAATALIFAAFYEDIDNFISGQPSLLGELVNNWSGAWKGLKVIVEQSWIWIKRNIKDGLDWISNGFTSMGDTIMALWENIKQTILDAIEAIKNGINGALNYVGLGGDVNVNGTRDALANAQSGLILAGSSSLNSLTTSSISNGARNANRTITVSVGEVTVETQATDATGIANDFGLVLGPQVRQAMANFDDGVDR